MWKDKKLYHSLEKDRKLVLRGTKWLVPSQPDRKRQRWEHHSTLLCGLVCLSTRPLSWIQGGSTSITYKHPLGQASFWTVNQLVSISCSSSFHGSWGPPEASLVLYLMSSSLCLISLALLHGPSWIFSKALSLLRPGVLSAWNSLYLVPFSLYISPGLPHSPSDLEGGMLSPGLSRPVFPPHSLLCFTLQKSVSLPLTFY